MVEPNDNRELYDLLMEKYAEELQDIELIECEPNEDVFNFIINDVNVRLHNELLDKPSSQNTSAEE